MVSEVKNEDKYLAIKYMNESEHYPIHKLCSAVHIARSAYYKWLKRTPSLSQQINEQLVEWIKQHYEEHNGILGYRQMTVVINREHDVHFNKKRIYRLIPNKNTQQNNTVNPNRKLSGDEKSKLNVYVQHNLRSIGYIPEVANKMCSIVVSHCNDPQMMNAIANDLKSTYSCHKAMYEDVKKMLEKYFKTNNLLSKPTTPNTSKREMEIRSFFGQHFKKQTYTKNKEKIIELILNAKSKSEINNGLQKLYSDNNVVKHINTEIKPMIKGLPGK